MSGRRESYIAQEDLRVNDRIRIPKVRVVDADGGQVGIVDTREALRMAQEQDLDLVEVAPTADPPVARIMDYGKYKYEQAVRHKEARKKQSLVVVKEVRMRPKIGGHDYDTKRGHAARFLHQGAKVKVNMWFRGRETVHPELGERLLRRFADELADIAKVDSPPKLDGRNMTMVLTPLKDAVAEKRGGTAPSKQHRRRPAEEPAAAPEVAEDDDKKPARPIKVTRAEGG